MTKKALFMMFFLIPTSILFLAGYGCKGDNEKIIGFIPMTMNNEYFVTMVNAAKQEADKLGVSLLVDSGDSHRSAHTQLMIAEEMIEKKVDAICLVPSSSSSALAVLTLAASKKIPVINIDTKINEVMLMQAGLKPVPFIGTDNYSGAGMGAKYAMDNLNIAGSQVAILTGIDGQLNAEDRRNGFVDNIKSVEIVTEQTANWEMDQGYEVTQKILRAHPEISFLSCGNDGMALGAVQAVKEVGKTDTIMIFGYDAVPAALDAIEEGEMVATVAQFPAEMGILGIQTALEMINGDAVELTTYTKTEVINKENVGVFKEYLKQFTD